MMCKECISFFRIELPDKAYSTYSIGLCQGCFEEKEVCSPNFWIKEVGKKEGAVVLTASLNPERIVHH